MIIIPISIINHLRNDVVNSLNKKREIRNVRVGKQEIVFDDIKVIKEEFSYTYKVNDNEQYEAIKDIVKSENIYHNLPECIYPYFRISNGAIKPVNKSILINELSDIDSSKEIVANMYLNTTNIYSLYTLYKLGCKRVTLSIEMSKERIEKLLQNYKMKFGYEANVEVMVYGKPDLMISKFCPINKILTDKDINCLRCKKDKFYLLDRKGYKLELIKDGLCNIRILNPKKLHLIEYCEYLKDIGVSKLRLEFTSESKEELKEVVNGYIKGELELLGVTRGYFL